MNWNDFKTVASFIGIPGAMMAVALVAIYKGFFVRRGEFDAVCKDRDEWKALALSSWTSAERLTTTTQVAVDHAAALAAKKV